MKINMKKPLIMCLLISLLLTGCGSKNVAINNESVDIKVENKVAESLPDEAIETGSGESENADTKSLTIAFVNSAGVDFGLLSIIDPISNEQINVDSLMKEEIISMDIMWPRKVSVLRWAVYDVNGDLVADSETDIEKANDSATITLLGQGKLEDASVSFE